MNYCLDSNTVVYYLKGTYPAIRERMEAIRPRSIYLPEMVYAELLYGVFRSEQRLENAKKLEAFVAPFKRLPFDERASEHYAEIRAYLLQSGQPIGPNDLIIASITRAAGMTLVTHNLKEFWKVPGLRLEDWTVVG